MDNRVSKYNTLNRKKLSLTKPQESRNGFHNSANTIQAGPQEVPETNPLQGREKNLKEVLTNLHDEFEALNK